MNHPFESNWSLKIFFSSFYQMILDLLILYVNFMAYFYSYFCIVEQVYMEVFFWNEKDIDWEYLSLISF